MKSLFLDNFSRVYDVFLFFCFFFLIFHFFSGGGRTFHVFRVYRSYRRLFVSKERPLSQKLQGKLETSPRVPTENVTRLHPVRRTFEATSVWLFTRNSGLNFFTCSHQTAILSVKKIQPCTYILNIGQCLLDASLDSYLNERRQSLWNEIGFKRHRRQIWSIRWTRENKENA